MFPLCEKLLRSGLKQMARPQTGSLSRSASAVYLRCARAFSQPAATETVFSDLERKQLCEELGLESGQILLTIGEVRALRASMGAHEKLGLVPTMGALHEGHVSLVQASVEDNHKTLSSLFVNAGQFAPHEDFGKYPRQPVEDIKALFAKGVDYVFVPSHAEMYPGSSYGQTSTDVCRTHVVPFAVDEKSEGAARPGFFRGVATVVCKLFNIVQPTSAYFGQKDGLQVLVIRQMVRDLNFPINVVRCPTLRESDGLAMSSRNVYLSPEERAAAPTLYAALQAVERAYEEGERSYSKLIQCGQAVLDEQPLFRTEYLSICDSVDATELNEVSTLPERNIMVSAAVNFGTCRILDNVLLGEQT